MNESKETCAPENVVLTDAERWKSIDQRKAEDYVRKLQARIVKAQRGRQTWQSQIFAVAVDPLVLRSLSCRGSGYY